MSTPPRVTAPTYNAPAQVPRRPDPTALQSPQEALNAPNVTLHPNFVGAEPAPKKKKSRNHRGGKKKRPRKQSFGLSNDGSEMPETSQSHRSRSPSADNAARASFYRLEGKNMSNTSIESEALLDHRGQQSMRPRRASTMGQGAFGMPSYDPSTSYRRSYQNSSRVAENPSRRNGSEDNVQGNDDMDNERTPLISTSIKSKSPTNGSGYGIFDGAALSGRGQRSSSKSSSKSRKRNIFERQPIAFPLRSDEYNVNYPPSIPGSPRLNPSNQNFGFGDILVRDEFAPSRASPRRGRDDTSEHAIDDEHSPARSRREPEFEGRRHTISLEAEEDVCFPIEGLSEMADEDIPPPDNGILRRGHGPGRRRGKWPDLAVLDEWSRLEKEGRSDGRRAKKITEPQLVGGRLRPIHKGWHRAEDDAPYRFTYFNEDFQSTIHSQTISELAQPGGSFQELFIPDPPELTDSEDSEDDEGPLGRANLPIRHAGGVNGDSRAPTRQASLIEASRPASTKGSTRTPEVKASSSREASGSATPNGETKSPKDEEKPIRYGERPTWWLDVLSPTDAEMKVLSKTFGIHPLTAEDIMMQEAREKVELFRNYYFVNYRTFEQDMNNENFLDPVNMYVVVFREGVISFHFSMTPHPANVRRRIRQLKDYLILSSDWISYAIIDDITDVFAPLIQTIEDEVDEIDDEILKLHSPNLDKSEQGNNSNTKDGEKRSEAGDGTSGESGGDMLRRVGDCRKKVMGLYRLLGNKADVIKGFAKRCNEQWDVAPRSEIGLYLGDIQDHIVTMTGNLSHYEKILARSHGNYLAQINIRMNERQEQTADVLGKLTVLGTIVLPMNIITGLWGMNVWVPGQDSEGDLTWFFGLAAGLLAFGIGCFLLAKVLYRIV